VFWWLLLLLHKGLLSVALVTLQQALIKFVKNNMHYETQREQVSLDYETSEQTVCKLKGLKGVVLVGHTHILRGFA
jgi:hypothetical protein